MRNQPLNAFAVAFLKGEVCPGLGMPGQRPESRSGEGRIGSPGEDPEEMRRQPGQQDLACAIGKPDPDPRVRLADVVEKPCRHKVRTGALLRQVVGDANQVKLVCWPELVEPGTCIWREEGSEWNRDRGPGATRPDVTPGLLAAPGKAGLPPDTEREHGHRPILTAL